MSSPKRCLVWLKPQFLGDAVMAIPLIDGLINSGRSVELRCSHLVWELFEGRHPNLTHLPAARLKGVKDLSENAKDLVSRKFDEAVILDRSFRSALTLWLSKIPVRIGHATEGRGFLLTNAMPYSRTRYEVDCFNELGSFLGLGELSLEPAVRLPVSGRDSSRLIGFQPGARYASKQYPIEKLAEVARDSQSKGFQVVSVGGPDEVEAAERFAALVGGSVVNLTGKGTLRESMEQIAGLRSVVGSDTGLMHVAAALGTPTITLFGPNPASKWGHHYAPHQVIEAPGGELSNLDSAIVTEALNKVLSASTKPALE